jgi:aminopeptidase N
LAFLTQLIVFLTLLFTPELKALQKQQLKTILATKNLSKDIFEIVQAALK